MKAKLLSIVISSLCIFSISNVALAQYSSSQTPNSGYSSSASSGNTTTTTTSVSNAPQPEHHREHKKEHSNFSFSVNIPQAREVFVERVHEHDHHHYHGPRWTSMVAGEPVPEDAVVSGGQSHPHATFFVCRAHYHDGTHPGKLFDGRCNISWGGEEVVLSHYEVLLSHRPLAWVSAHHGDIPNGALEGGHEHGQPLFICQADYRNGRHTGKVVGNGCNFGWGGKEVSVPYYNVLVG